MNEPHVVLGVASDADEQAIRKRYLELVRRHTPDRDPQRFAEIHAAYEALRDPVRRLEKQLFECRARESFDAILAETRRNLQNVRISTDVLLSLADS